MKTFNPGEAASANLRIAVEHLDTWKRNILDKLAEIANVTTDRDTRLELDELMDRIADEVVDEFGVACLEALESQNVAPFPRCKKCCEAHQ